MSQEGYKVSSKNKPRKNFDKMCKISRMDFVCGQGMYIRKIEVYVAIQDEYIIIKYFTITMGVPHN